MAADEPAWHPTYGRITGMTVEVAPGTYTEYVYITARFLTLKGAGVGQTFLTTGTTSWGPGWTAAIYVRSNPVYIEGFTIRDSTAGVLVYEGARVHVVNCEFTGNGQALWSQGGNLYVLDTPLANNDGGVYLIVGAVAQLTNVPITGTGPEYSIGVEAYHQSSVTISSNTTPPAAITNHYVGIWVRQSSFVIAEGVDLTGNVFGGWATEMSQLRVASASVTNNTYVGLGANQMSYLFLGGDVTVSGNGGPAMRGIQINNFARALLMGTNTITDQIFTDDSGDYRIR